MSIIGRIGQFMIDNQETIGAIILIAFAIILLWLLIRLILKNSKRKKAEEAERNALIEELKQLSQDNKELLAAFARVNDKGLATEPAEEIATEPAEEIAKEPAEEIAKEPAEEIAKEPAIKTGAIDEELVKELEDAAGGTVEEIIAKAIPAAREADEASKIAAETVAPAPVVEPALVVEPKPMVEPALVVEPKPMAEPEPVVEPAPVVAQPEYFAPQREAVAQEAEKAEPARAYMSREAGVDKFGNVYTEEMLKNQIG